MADPIPARQIIAHCLLMGRGAYPSPLAWADAVLKRLADEGYSVMADQPADPRTKADLETINGYFAITDGFIGGGCEHGFRPASQCPNDDCSAKLASEAWTRLVNAANGAPA